MLKNRGVSWVLALALALVGVVANPTTAAAATTITVSAAQEVQAQMAVHYGSTTSAANGGTPNYQSSDCLRMGAAGVGTTTGTVANTNGTQPSSATTGNTAYYFAGTTVWAGHGRTNSNCPGSLNLSQQSSLGFSPATVSSFTPGGIFNLGQITHKNTGIQVLSGNEFFRGNLNLQFMGMTLTYAYEMDETTGTNQPDTTTFLNQISNQTFTSGGITYTLIIRGFTAPQNGTTCNATVASLSGVTTVFTTPENATTTGCLYAQIQQVRTLRIQKQAAAPYGAPAAYPAFSFGATSDVAGSDWGSAFSLTPTGTGIGGQAYRTGNLVTGQTININESAPASADWTFTSLSCVDGAGSSSISGLTVNGASLSFSGDYGTTSATAAPITCTFTNTFTPHATLTLVKQVTTTGQPGTVASPADWTLSATGNGAVSGQTVSGASGGAAVTARSVIAGSYTLGEVAANPATTAGYVQDGSWSCTAGSLSGNTLTLAAGQSATCTIRNTFAVGRLAITKTVTGNGYAGGTGKAFTAAYTCTSGGTTVKSGTVTVHPGAANGTAGAAAVVDAVPAGANCTVTESNPPTGTSTGLVDDSWVWGTPVANPGVVTIGADATSTVNLTNPTTRQFGSFEIAAAITPRSGVPGAGYNGGSTRTFPITYACTLGGATVGSGTVDVSTGASRTISGIPASSTCSVTTEDQSAKNGDFLDASYAWDGYAASSPVTVTANGTATVTVTNYFRRDLVTLNLAKVVTGSGYAGSGADFSIGYDCGAPYAGTVSVAAGGSQSVTVPAGVACTVSEKAPSAKLLRPGYVWDDPTYSGLTNGSVTVPRAGSATVTVTNPTSIGYGRIQVTKAVDSFGSQVTNGTIFTVRVACDAAAQGTAGDYSDTFPLTWPSSVTAITPYLPVGTSCTVTETDAPSGHDALPNGSYAWKAVPDAVSVTVPATENAREVTVTNDIRRVTATLRIVKDVVNHTGHDAGGAHFSGTYRCDYNNGETVRSGSWAITGQGTAETVDVLVGSVCTVSEDNPGAPVDGDRSYSWSTQTPDPTTVGADGATATVVNTLNRAEGSFNVAKSVDGGTAGTAFPAGADFRFSYTCTPLTGDPVSGSFTVATGDSAAPGDAIPGGSTCTVTEGDDPSTIDPYRWDGVSLSVSGDAGNTGQDGRGITFTTTDDEQPVSVRVVDRISARTASVRVSKTVTGETAGYTGGAVFPVTLNCTTGPQGTKNVAGGDSVTWDGIPLGATCSASEGSATGGLADGSWAWGSPTIGDAVKLTDSGTYDIAIKNPVTRVYAGIEIAKLVDVGGFSGVADPDQVFTGTWNCRHAGDDTVSGTWSGKGSDAGTLATLSSGADHILVGSDCTVSEDISFGAPSADPSYRWDATPRYHGVTVATGAGNRLTVTNTLLRDTGKVTATKQVAGETAGYAPGASFAGFSVTARCYLHDPDEPGHLEATVAVRPGDQATVIDGVPFGWTCTVSEGSFPNPDQLRDASYAWDTQTVAFGNGTPTTTVSAGNTSPDAVVTNRIRRVTGRLAITKAFGNGTADAVRPGTSFSGGYACTYGSDHYTGTWSVTGDGDATLSGDTDIPFTAECTASENDPDDSSLVDSSYTWAKPDLGGTVRIASASEPAQLVVTNTATRRWSGLEVTKTYDGPDGAFASDLELTGTWSCSYRGQVAASGGWRLPASGGSVVVARPDQTAIPAASVCTVTEDSLSAGQLTDASFAWQPATYSPDDGSVTTAAGGTAKVTVTNAVTRVRSTFAVTKRLHYGTGVSASAIESDLTFSGRYRCTHTGDDPVSGDWGPVAAGGEWTSPPVLLGSNCSVTGEDEPGRPSRTDDSYLWGTPDLGDPVTVGQATPVVVTNPITRVTGSFGVSKVVTGDTEAIPAATEYTFSWRCTAANGDTFPAGAPGSFAVTDGGTWNAPEDVPVGSSCSVTENTPPDASDPSYAWTTELTAVNATASTAGRTITFTLPRGGAPVSVTATNTLTRTKGSFRISKSSDPAGGATVLPGQAIHYTLTVTPARLGFTRDVVVTDDLSGVLAHAGVTDISASQGSAQLAGTDLVWTVGTVKAGTALTLTYTATVASDALGVDLTNTVAATGETAPPACGAACTTVHHVPSWTLAKTSDPASGTVVQPGDLITYTLTAANTSAAVVTGASATDDLTGLADADVSFTSAALSRSGDTLTWAIPTMAPGESRSVTYTARVKAGADGAVLRNAVTPHGAGASCAGACGTTHSTVKWELAKASSPASGAVVAPGDTVTYTLSVTNTGPVALSGAKVSDDISDVVDDATLGTLPAGITRSGTTLTWAVPDLAAGATASVSYPATVKSGALGATLRNTAAPATGGGRCDGACSTTQFTPSWTLAKTSTAGDGATVLPGDTVGYTLTVRNTGPATLHGASVTDDLSDVLDDAELVAVPAGASLSGTTLTWVVPDVAPGDTATLGYQVRVTATGATLHNVATPAGVGGSCAASCSTTAVTPRWTLAKTSDPASGAVVAVGDTITYTLTATNTGPGVVSGASATDDLSSVLANADLGVTSAQLSLSGSTLTWAIPTLLPGEHASVSYTATVRESGITVTNSVTANGPGGTCLACSTNQSTPRWSLTKTSDPASGGTVVPGDTITYTLTAVNEGPVPVTGATATDDLTDVLDDATVGTLPTGLSLSGSTLTWTLPTIAVGGVASVSYPVTVKPDATGATITNSALPVGAGGHCALSCATTAYTDAWTLAKTSSPADGATVAPGDTISYTLTVRNTGPATLHGASVHDDLADVLDDADLGALPAGATLTGTTLAWAVPDVPAGGIATLAYTAVVREGATGARLRNVAAPASSGGSCGSSCSTTGYTGAWTLSKSAVPASGVVVAGDTITWTLTAHNTSQATISGATASDELASVLAAAELDTLPAELSLDGTTLTWAIPVMAPGQTRTVTYSAILRAGADGATLTNAVVPVGSGGACAACTTTHTTPGWSLAKSSDPASGAVVVPGQVIGYTLTVTNTGPATLAGAQVHDDVSDLLDDADLAALPAGLTRSGSTLTWAVPAVAAGATASITYDAIVKADASGATLTNMASPASTGGSCTSCSTAHYTPAWTLAKASSVGTGATVKPGDSVDYTLTVHNAGPATLTGARVHDDLADVLDDADLAALPAGAVLDGSTMTWSVPDVAPGASASLTYRVVVRDGSVGARLANTAAPDGAGGSCAPDACATVAYTPSWTLTKASAPASGTTVKPGDVITYTLTATNTSDAEIRGALALDDLSKVLPYADVDASGTGLTLSGTSLTWAIPTLAAGEHASATYTATVRAGADGVTVANSVTPVGAGGSCVGDCATSQSTGAWTLAKTSDAGPQVLPGQPIHYTLTVTNTGPVPVSGAIAADDLTGILDDAVVGDLGPNLERTGSTLVWSVPDVPVGGHVSVGYTATVAASSAGGTLTNTASVVTSGGRCDVCTTTSWTPAWTLAKTSDPADGATVAPGDTISYTLAVTNTGSVALSGAVVSDDVSGVVAHATLGALPAGVTRAGDTLTWAVPDVPVGGTATVTYAATVDAGATGATLRNVATPASAGGSCPESCSTAAHTGAWTLAKSSTPGDGAVVTPGDTITYTLTASNTSDGVVAGATATDDLSDVLDDATLGPLPAGLTLDGSTLRWAIPTLAAGETRTVSYAVTVDHDGATIANTASPDGVGGSCLVCSTTAHSVAWTLAKASDAPSIVTPGDVITYTLTVANTGPVAVSGASVTDDLSDVLDDATLGALPAGTSLAGTALTWAVPDVPVGGTASISYTVQVGNPGARLANTASPASAGGTCPGSCSTTSYTRKWSLAKASDQPADAVVRPGDTIGYTLTVTNEAPTALTGAVVRDDLSDVLDDATLVALPEGATLDGTTLVWAVPDVPVDGTARLTYQVTLHDDARGATVRNLAVPASAGGQCGADRCETTAFTTDWTLAKTSDPGSGATVVPGDRITYTLTVTNTGPVALTGADVHDNMADLLDDASLVGALPEGTTMAGTTLTWSVPDVPVGGTAQLHYTVVVNPGAYGTTLGNVAWGDGVVSCVTGVLGEVDPAADSDCSTRHYSPAWSLAKTSDPAPGTIVVPGDDVTYTLRVRNTSQAVVDAAVVTDDLSDVLTYATLVALPAGATLSGTVLTWTVPTLQPGDEATIAYTVTVGEDAYNASFTNTAVPGAAGSCPDTCTATLETTRGVVDPVHDDDGDGGKSNGGDLAYTGADLSALGLGVVALAAGAGLMVVGRKRRDQE